MVLIDWQTFGRAIARERKARKLTQTEAARLFGISRNYLSMIEVGRMQNISYAIVADICIHLSIKMPRVSLAQKATQHNDRP
jgi:transcriptional regulator with XRE-family HTH domain